MFGFSSKYNPSDENPDLVGKVAIVTGGKCVLRDTSRRHYF